MQKRRVIMADVAELAEVSKMTVSRVLNNKPGVAEPTRQRILDAMETLGYMPTADMRTYQAASKLIGLLISDITSSYMAEVLGGVARAAYQLDYRLVLYIQGMGNQIYQNVLPESDLVDGVLMVGPRNYESIVHELKNRDLPYVIIDHHSQTGEEPSVTATNRKGMLDATRYLLVLKHQRIGFITGRMDIACSHDRLQGYKEGLAEAMIPFDPELVCEGDYHQPSGFESTQELLRLPNPPTAIIASNDLMAFGAIHAAREAGLTLGKDISIIGFDDIYLASQTSPRLTTVHQPLAEMGKAAMETLVTLLEGRTVLTVRKELPTELIIRDTTGPAPY